MRQFKTEWQNDTYREAKDAMKTLLNLANSMGSQQAVVSGMLDALVSEHRTLQQAGIRNIAAMLKEWTNGSESALTDLRNEAAWEFAKAVSQVDIVMPCI